MHRSTTTALLLALFMPALAGAAQECKFSAQRDFDVDAAGLKTLALDLGSSDAQVEGVAGLGKVEVRARACASRAEWLDQLTVEQQRSGERLSVTPQVRHDALNFSLGGSSYAWIDLHVRVPAALAIDLKAASGDAKVHDVAALDFDLASGDLQVQSVAGMLAGTLASGDIEGRDVGALDLRRVASGDAQLSGVRGDARVGAVASGDVTLTQVGGGVTVGSVGSGDLRLTQVARDVHIDRLGSGDVDVQDVGGDLTVRHKGSGDLQHRNVRGKVELPRHATE